MEELERLKTGFEKDDLFERKAIVENLIKVVNASNQCRVIAIDSEWGSGKTTFLRKWQNYIEKTEASTKCIFFDAWEHDYYIDPIVPIVGILEELIEPNDVDYNDVKKAFKSIVFEIIKVFTANNLDMAKLESELMSSARRDLLAYTSLKEEKHLIRQSLAKVSNDKKVYVFIDELDRCKPTFAIQLLERLKHFFQIENFVFVIGVDLHQLGKSIKSVYGEIDSYVYFKKFFDISIILPNPEEVKYFSLLAEELKSSYSVNPYLIKNIAKLIEVNKKITLREVDQIIDIIKVSHSMLSNFRHQLELTPFLILFKVKQPELYRKYLKNEIEITDEIIENYNLDEAYGKKSTELIDQIKILSIQSIAKRYEAANNINYFIDAEYSLATFANTALEFKSIQRP